MSNIVSSALSLNVCVIQSNFSGAKALKPRLIRILYQSSWLQLMKSDLSKHSNICGIFSVVEVG
jgi:hypothetical protein